MKALGVIEVDLACNGLGLASRCLTPLGERSMLAASVARLRSAEGIDDVVVSVRGDDAVAVGAALAGQDCHVETRQHEDISHRKVLRRARKWALEGWRGGIGGMTHFDEQGAMAELARLMDAYQADVVVTARAEAPLMDPSLVAGVLGFLDEQGEDLRFVFTTAPPGLCAEAYRRAVVEEFAAARQSPGFTLKYYPRNPGPDLIDGPCCMKIPLGISVSPFRYVGDSARGQDRVQRLHALGQGRADARGTTTLMAQHPELWPGSVPREVEIEITTERNLDDRLLPPPQRLPSRGPMSLDTFSRIVEQLAQAGDDVLVTLGGFGQALRHPDVVDMVRVAHEAGIYGIAVVTDGIDLTGALADQLVQSELDVVLVQLDAHSAATYERLKGQDRYEEVVTHVQEFIDLRRRHDRPCPFLVTQFTKVREAMPEMDDFFDHWLTHADWAVLRSHDDRAGQIPSLAVMQMAPGRRRFCRRLFSRMTILSDGKVVLCESDFAGHSVVGDAGTDSVTDLWLQGVLARARGDHLAGRWDTWDLCAGCREWHRP